MPKYNIAWNTFEPALTDDNWKTSTGDGMWLTALWKYLRSNDFNVFNVSVGEADDRNDFFDNVIGSVRLDVIVLSWRWEMPDYPQRQAAFLRQQKLIEMAMRRKIPVLIHNSNLMPNIMNAENWAAEIDNAGTRVKLTAPIFYPIGSYETLHFVCPPVRKSPKPFRSQNRIYIGNNYGRYQEAVHWFGGLDINIHGNWLEPSPHREPPAQVLQDFGLKARFPGRVSQKEAVDLLRDTVATVHIAREDYYKHGFMAYRYAEVALAGCYAFVPWEMNLPERLRDFFSDNRDLWRSTFTPDLKKSLIFDAEKQFEAVAKEMRPSQWKHALLQLIGTGE